MCALCSIMKASEGCVMYIVYHVHGLIVDHGQCTVASRMAWASCVKGLLRLHTLLDKWAFCRRVRSRSLCDKPVLEGLRWYVVEGLRWYGVVCAGGRSHSATVAWWHHITAASCATCSTC
jgi:hypothetical protein